MALSFSLFHITFLCHSLHLYLFLIAPDSLQKYVLIEELAGQAPFVVGLRNVLTASISFVFTAFLFSRFIIFES